MKKIIYILLIALVLTGCGKVDKTVQSEIENDVKEEVVQKEEAEDKDQETSEDTQSETSENNTQTSENIKDNQSAVTKTTMYAKSNVNVRSGAGTSNAQIGSLTKGQEVVKVGEENGWSKIEFNGTVGYVSSKYLSTEKVEVSTNNSNTGNKTNNNTTSNPNNGGSTNTGNNNTTTNQNTVPSVPVHEHKWTEVTEDEIHYYAWRNICGKCGTDLTDMNDDDMLYHVTIICSSRYGMVYKEVDFVTENVVKTPVVVGYKCSCGATKEK